jgi:hypothetical protein
VLYSLQDHLETETRDLDHPVLTGAENTDTTPPCRNLVVQSLHRALHSILGVGYNVDQEEKVKSFWGSAFIKLKKTNFLPFLSKGKH